MRAKLLMCLNRSGPRWMPPYQRVTTTITFLASTIWWAIKQNRKYSWSKSEFSRWLEPAADAASGLLRRTRRRPHNPAARYSSLVGWFWGTYKLYQKNPISIITPYMLTRKQWATCTRRCCVWRWRPSCCVSTRSWRGRPVLCAQPVLNAAEMCFSGPWLRHQWKSPAADHL